ncbi:MAG: SRPBCC domain-containing protein [Baekduia sp.]
MTVTDVRKDIAAKTMVIESQFNASAERIWQLWEDPRQLERWWGPPGYPATFTTLELRPGGVASYFMTSPEGEQFHGGWNVVEVNAPNRLVVDDYFADETGAPNNDMPTGSMTVTISEAGGVTTMAIESRHATAEDLQKVLQMGMEEGMVQALGQIEAILAD